MSGKSLARGLNCYMYLAHNMQRPTLSRGSQRPFSSPDDTRRSELLRVKRSLPSPPSPFPIQRQHCQPPAILPIPIPTSYSRTQLQCVTFPPVNHHQLPPPVLAPVTPRYSKPRPCTTRISRPFCSDRLGLS